MSARVFQLVDAVVSDLNAAFAGQFTAIRSTVPLIDLKTMGTALSVRVLPRTVTPEQLNRGTWVDDVEIDIGVQQKVEAETGAAEEAAIEAVVSVAEQIRDFLRGHVLASLPNCRPLSVKHDPVVHPEHMRAFRLCTSIVSVSYRQ